MESRQLGYFIEVAKQLSFSKAAEKLNVTQPTLSKMVKNLEEELDVLLFDRTTKHMELTDAGEIVFEEAQEIMRMMNNLSDKLADRMKIKKGHVKIGLPPVIGSLFFPNLIRDFRQYYPNIQIGLEEEGAKKVEKMIEEGTVDFGVAVLPVNQELFDSNPFVKSELKLIVYDGHPLAEVDTIPLKRLKNESFLFMREGFALHDRIREHCIQAGFNPNVIYESSQWDFITEMVANGNGVAILPEPLCRKLDPSVIKAISIIEPKIPWDLAVIWKKNKYLSYATKELLQFIKFNFPYE
ncbi:LysR family transcriptional regulator [Neobacillus sp. PS3-12]|jgi:DNA-binding transcriptional LysR family regulator|uniref:LysR family transcriptional regulator n=1 Tax=Neobacillus sp. PS3-12 TaxID=3070677 RepID=UPI0027DFEEF6|nr:LysR family transcriptional regulator [Neobacillus sp. PS3-12]WML51347.1 LysR family transcriptional regulator [Neobacillus sp. PS3-12]